MDGLKLVDLVNEEVLRGGSVDKADKVIKEGDIFEKEILSNPIIHYYTLDDSLSCHPETQADKINGLKDLIIQKYDSRYAKIPNESYECNISFGDLQKTIDMENENFKDYKFFNHYNPFRKNHGTTPKPIFKTMIYDAAFLAFLSMATRHPRPVLTTLILGAFYLGDSKRRYNLKSAKNKIAALEKELVPYKFFKENLKNAEVKVHYSVKAAQKVEELKGTFAGSDFYQFDYDRINRTLMSMRGLTFTGSNVNEWH
jgi:hypothetical protein